MIEAHRLGLEREHRVDRVEDLARGHHLVHRPVALGVEGHELDEADAHPVGPAVGRDVDDLVVVDAADHDRVELHGREAGGQRGVDPGQHPVELVALR